MRSRSSRVFVAQIMLGVLLFAQAALAGAACSMPERSPARAIAGFGSMPCHQADPDQRNANLCLADCLSFDQSSSTPALPVIAPPPAPVLIVPLVEPAVARAVVVQFTLPHPPAPPPRILFQSFLI